MHPPQHPLEKLRYPYRDIGPLRVVPAHAYHQGSTADHGVPSPPNSGTGVPPATLPAMRALLPLFLCLAQILPAQEPLCLVKRFGVEDGLLNRRVTAVAQDREGFLWIGTPGGLHRFDGYVFKTYTTTDGLSSNVVDAIWTDADGLLWLVRGGTRSDLDAVSIDIMDPRTGR